MGGGDLLEEIVEFSEERGEILLEELLRGERLLEVLLRGEEFPRGELGGDLRGETKGFWF